MRDATFTIKAETELNPDEKRRLSELAEAFVFQAEKFAWGANHDLLSFSSVGSSGLTLDSTLQLDLGEKVISGIESNARCPESEADAGAEYEISGFFVLR
jgi:hypothetical protein